ncbi:hypothetical protein QCN27_15695 [Cereibacter sp. SYSU M97828]|nr:hypothetical protein [Cereibacter flavus]
MPCLYKPGHIPAPPVPKPQERDWSAYIGLEVAPCREIGFGKPRQSEVCLPCEAEFFTIYGREASGMAVALEDEKAADDIAAMLSGCIEASGLKVCYFDGRDFAPSQRYGTISDMCDRMAERIAEDMPDTDDLEVFAAAMEAHPLDPYREAFADACHHNGRDELRGRADMALQNDLFEIDKGQHGAEWVTGNWQCRNFNGWFQQREGGEGPWQFVVYAFGVTDCTIYRLNKAGGMYQERVPIDEQDRITVGRRKYGREHWTH